MDLGGDGRRIRVGLQMAIFPSRQLGRFRPARVPSGPRQDDRCGAPTARHAQPHPHRPATLSFQAFKLKL